MEPKALPIAEFLEKVAAFNHHHLRMWNERNLEKFCEGYTVDATMTIAGHEPLQGRERILEVHNGLYRDRSLMGHMLSVEILATTHPDGAPCSDSEKVTMVVALVRIRVENRAHTTYHISTGRSLVVFKSYAHGLQISMEGGVA